jgi:hypothetical protein
MMKYTEHYNLKKPEYEDAADISDINDNFDAIDEKLKELEDSSSGGEGGPEYEYQTASIVDSQIRLIERPDSARYPFILSSNVSGSPITISTDGGTTSKPLKEFDGTNVTYLEAGFQEVVADEDFFTLVAKRPRKLILDNIPGAIGAYALTRLKAFATKCLRVRRSSDNAETDIGFIGNSLDTAALLSFVGSGNGYVSVWYDQSGLDNHLVQSTAASQPQIVNNGAITDGILFSTHHMVFLKQDILKKWAILTRLKHTGIFEDYEAIVNGEGGTNPYPMYLAAGKVEVSDDLYTANPIPNNTETRIVVQNDGTISSIYVDNESVTNAENTTICPQVIMRYYAEPVEYFKGSVYKLIIFNNALTFDQISQL